MIHCAAWTAVDAAEETENVPKVRAINGDGTCNIAAACRSLDCRMMYISTDYVFDGQGTEPWKPDCAAYAPLNVYGQTKLEGELAVRETLEKYFIVRIAWVFGRNGRNFVKTMLNAGRTHGSVQVVNDQIGTPTYTYDLARLLVDMIETEKYGCYHATNEGGVHQLVRFLSRNLPSSRLKNGGHPGDNGRIRPEQGGEAVQQPAGQVETGRERLYAAAGLAGCAGKVFEAGGHIMRAGGFNIASEIEAMIRRRYSCK